MRVVVAGAAVIGLGGTGDNAPRKRLGDRVLGIPARRV